MAIILELHTKNKITNSVIGKTKKNIKIINNLLIVRKISLSILFLIAVYLFISNNHPSKKTNSLLNIFVLNENEPS